MIISFLDNYKQMKNTMLTLTAKTFAGLEEVLAGELSDLGAAHVKAGRRAVTFTGDHGLMMRANLWARTALSILRHVNTFSFSGKDSFYEQMRDTDWGACFDVDKTISVHAVATRSELFTNTMYLGQLTKDAVADHFRDRTGRRPDVDPQDAQIRINVYVYDQTCTVSLDSSGDALFRRGYRREAAIAPLNEILAAGLIRLSRWDGQSLFLDPMCGSGTFSVEAAMMASRMAPGLLRKSFSFMHWKDYDPDGFASIREEARQQQVPLRASIIASDVNIKALDITRQNIMEAGFLGQIRVQRNDFFSYHPPAENGWLLMNPPYGHRIKQDNIQGFYEQLGATLKHHFPGYTAGVISQEINRLKHVGLKPKRKIRVFNGPLECLFMVYELFRGPHREHVVQTRPRRPRL